MSLSRLVGTAVRVVEIIPLRVVGIVPVVEIVPVRVVEIVPDLVVEIMPLFAKAALDTAKTNKAEQRVHFRVFMVLSWCFESSSLCRFVRVAAQLFFGPTTSKCSLRVITCQEMCQMPR